MSVCLVLDNPPEFFTNLDHVTGRVLISLKRQEQVGSIVVKLEGESKTAQTVNQFRGTSGPAPTVVSEDHKVLYRVQQVFPDDYHSSLNSPYGAYPLQPGDHEFPFRFKVPINNGCGNASAMARIGGLNSTGGFFGLGNVRLMDGSKQLMLTHVTRTLPPSLTGFPGMTGIRYYIKVTVIRPGLLKDNWRRQIGLKFLPIEPPRPAKSGKEVFARRPFNFHPQRSSLLAKISGNASPGSGDVSSSSPPSIEMAARLPFPPILTCNKPIPLRLLAKKLDDGPEQVFLVSFQLDLIGITKIEAHGIHENKTHCWVVACGTNLSIPLPSLSGNEMTIPDEIWRNRPLPNTVAPSFLTCNISRRYELQIKLGLAWTPKTTSKKGRDVATQTIYLPLHFDNVDVYSGITPPPELLKAASTTRPPEQATVNSPPRLPPRTSVPASASSRRPSQSQNLAPPQPPRPPHDPLYPPQLAPGQRPANDAPPSYDEAMAENLSSPFQGQQARPAYSGVTNVNEPSRIKE